MIRIEYNVDYSEPIKKIRMVALSNLPINLFIYIANSHFKSPMTYYITGTGKTYRFEKRRFYQQKGKIKNKYTLK